MRKEHAGPGQVVTRPAVCVEETRKARTFCSSTAKVHRKPMVWFPPGILYTTS